METPYTSHDKKEGKKVMNKKHHISVKTIIMIGIVFLVAFCQALYIDQKSSKYTTAITYIEDGKYDAAIEILEEFRDSYKNSDDYLIQAKNGKLKKEAKKAEESGDYDKAIKLLKEIEIDDFDYEMKDTINDAIEDVKLEEAISLYEDEEYEEALLMFGELGYYGDARSYYYKCIAKVYDSICPTLYIKATNDVDDGNYEEALETFEYISGYSNSSEWITALKEKLNK